MVTTLYLVRHGETEGSETKRYKGSIDVPLSKRGLEQAKAASLFIQEHLRKATFSKYTSYLRDIHTSNAAEQRREGPSSELQSFRTSRLQAVYTSNLTRAISSAEIVAAPYDLKPCETPDLRERNFGLWEGMTFNEIQGKYPEEFEAWANDPLRHSPIGGESTLEVKERTIPCLNEILKRHEGDNIAVVAHGGVNRIILCHILGMPLENIFRLEQEYAAVNIVEFWDRYPVVKLINGV